MAPVLFWQKEGIVFCPSCSKEIPEGSTFCLHCGGSVSVSKPQAVTEWEYKDFVSRWKPGSTWVRISGPNSHTLPGARLSFWQGAQHVILAGLQEWIDRGWTPVGEVGPGSIVLHQYRSMKGRSVVWWAFSLFIYVCTFGVWLIVDLLSMDHYVEPVEFRLQMRHPKAE